MNVMVLWPDGPRSVPESRVITWAQDSYYNSADYYVCVSCGCCQHSKVERWPDNGCLCEDTRPMYLHAVDYPHTIDAAIEWLDRTGEVTFARGTNRERISRALHEEAAVCDCRGECPWGFEVLP